ncbi:MAG: hypothetical protein JWO80_1898 [Bryobacterales bacterium]|nr:hypothetical protein [Bryobacterales bacterium]
MRRGVHITVALLAVFLLLRPFDCFSGGKFDKKAADCCKKGKCTPSNSDDCCKATIPGGKQLVTEQATDHSAPVLAVVATAASVTDFQLSATIHFVEIHQPPGSPPDLRLNLPLLI